MIIKALQKQKIQNYIQRHLDFTIVTPLIAIFIVIAVFQIQNPTFLSYEGLVTIVYSMSYFLIAACGLTLVIMMGSFDFSSVSILKLSALICVLYIDRFGMMVIPLALAVSAGFGFINGFLFAKLKVPSFMGTLGISIVIDGIALLVSRGFLHMMVNLQFRSLAVTFIGGIPSVFHWAIGIWLVCTIIALMTPFGRKTFAIGGNARAAAVSGINVDLHRILVFTLSGLLSGIAGVFYMAQIGGGSVEIGGQMMIPLFASVVAGGTSLRGGIGGPQRTIMGVIIITWIQAGLLMQGHGREIQMIFLGLIAIMMSVLTTDRGKLNKSIVK